MKTNMSVSNDCLGISGHKVFENFRSSLNECKDQKLNTQNIIDCRGDLLYLWDSVKQNVCTINLKNVVDGKDKERYQKYQTLSPTDPPAFAVERLLVNETGTQVALAGPRGAAVLELPRRWGRDGNFAGGKDIVRCRCRTLDERYFVCNPYVGVLRVRWHPGSETDSHLVVLTSENSIRVYETLDASGALLRVWPLGPSPHGSLSSAPRVPFLVGLGDTAVDFDFAPAELIAPHGQTAPPPPRFIIRDDPRESSTTWKNANAIRWPMLVLHGNGDVSKVVGSLSEDSECEVQGPLSMFPPAEDNYGADACGLLVLPSSPPVTVIASSDGMLYHAALLPAPPPHQLAHRDKSWSQYDSTYPSQSPSVALYVLECVELELGLALDDEVNMITCPIHLHRHPVSNDRYLCSHDAGVHSVALPLIPYLEHFINTEDALPLLEAPAASQGSVVEYILCTRTAGSDTPVPVLGLGLTLTPTPAALVLLRSEVLSKALPSALLPPLALASSDGASASRFLPPPASEFNSPLKQILKESFETKIKQILKKNSTQPILKISSGSNLSAWEMHELVARTIQTFREEYLMKHDLAQEEIERRVRTLRALKEHQLKDLAELDKEKVPLQQATEELAEKYEDAKERQEVLTKRAEQVLRLMVQKQPVTSVAEKKFGKDLEAINELLVQFRKGLQQVKAKRDYHREQVKQWQAQQRKRDVYLNQARASTIRTSLTKVTEEIAELVRAVHSVKDDLQL